MSFGRVIRAQRELRGLTVTAVAAEVGISVGYLSRIERDYEKSPRDQLIHRIAGAIGLPGDQAFAAARRLPPDLRERAGEVFALFRKTAC
jgi:transcriptional regulator with XRE-family HTH domain